MSKKKKKLKSIKNFNSKTYGIFTFIEDNRPPLPKGETISCVPSLFEIFSSYKSFEKNIESFQNSEHTKQKRKKK